MTASTKSKSTKSNAKGKGSKKEAASDLDELFSGMPAANKKKSGSKKDDHVLPESLKKICDLYVSGIVVSKAVEAKKELAEKKIKGYCVERWAEQFVETGVRPATCVVHGLDTQFDFIQTERIDMNVQKLKGLKMIGFDPLEKDENGELKHVHLTAMSIDMEAVRRVGGKDLEEKVKAALGKVLGEHAKDFLNPVVNFKPNFVNNIVNIARASLDEEKQKDKKEVLDRVKNMMSVLTPRTQARNGVSTQSDAECFTFVADYELETNFP